MARTTYETVFGLSPPQFYCFQDVTDYCLTVGELKMANSAVFDAKRLTACDDEQVEDPTTNLNRMGILDLVNHENRDTVLLVIQTVKNSVKTPCFT